MSSAVRHIFRWDLDKTYLRTDFDTVRALVRTARLSAEERENIPGSAALMRGIKASAPPNEHLIYFISGSPQQLRATIEKKFQIDGFAPDGFVLKPAVSYFLRGRFRAIANQIPYKLGALLHGRSEAPIGVQESLLGDDAESDAFIYSIYADLVSGKLEREGLRKLLLRAGAYPDDVAYVEHELEAIVHEDAVRRIVIHLDQLTPPAAFIDYFPLVVPIYNHLQTAIVLYLDGTIGPEAIRLVAGELIERFGFDIARLANSAEDILRRQRSSHPPEAFDRLLQHLEALPRGEVDAIDRVLDRIADRVRYLRDRPRPSAPPGTATGPRDYVALFERDLARRDDARRARKLAIKARAEEATEE